MDSSRLSQALFFLRQDEDNYKLQNKLALIQSCLEALAANPADSSQQEALGKAIRALSDALHKADGEYSSAARDRIDALGARPYFSMDLVDNVRSAINQNPMNPAVALLAIQDIVKDRKQYVDRVRHTESGIDSFVNYDLGVESGEAVVGFEIPRSIFDNDFVDFISELRVIQRVIRVFSEVETGQVAEVKLGKLSSSDPFIFLNAPPVIVGSIAVAISWLLTQWKSMEEIRKLRAETAKLGKFEMGEMERFFDAKISENMNKAIEAKVKETMEHSALDATRKMELDSELTWAFKALIARIERGMRVEVQAEKISSQTGDGEDRKTDNLILGEIEDVGFKLEFPKVEAEPMLYLPKVGRGDAEEPVDEQQYDGSGVDWTKIDGS